TQANSANSLLLSRSPDELRLYRASRRDDPGRRESRHAERFERPASGTPSELLPGENATGIGTLEFAMSGNGLAPWITLLFLVVLNACAERDRIAGTPQEEELPQNLAPVIDSLAVGDTFLPLGDATDLEVF